MKKKHIIFSLLLPILLIGWLLALKGIYWAVLDYHLLFDLPNTLAMVCYVLVHALFFLFAIIAIFFPTRFEMMRAWLKRRLIITIIVIVVSLVAPMYIFAFSDWGVVFSSYALKFIFFLADIFLLVLFFKVAFYEKNTIALILIALLLLGCSYSLAVRFRRVVDYPFSLNWSEGNRFWDYSTLFAKDRYSYSGDLVAFIDYGRLTLWGIAYLLPNLTVRVMRLWNELLYILPSLILGIVLLKDKTTPPLYALLGSLWVYLFLNQGPIYAPLILSLIIVVLATKLSLIPGLLFCMFAGYYAQLTRYTWSVAPAMWAGLLILFDKNRTVNHNERYRKAVFYLIAGIIGGVLLPIFFPVHQGVYQSAEGQTNTIIDRLSFTLSQQDLIWARLLPNSTNHLGIITSILVATLPTLYIVFQAAKKDLQKFGKWEKTYLLLTLLATFGVGSIVSIKIGGGSNLHNFDMYFLTIVLLMGIFKDALFQFLGDIQLNQKPKIILLLILSIFLLFQREIWNIAPLSLPSKSVQENVLHTMQEEIDRRETQGEILFIDQRQLLTFQYIKAPLVVDYEKKVLMNEALSKNSAYFSKFYTDLRNHRFSLIINEPLNIVYQEDEASYSEENNAYVHWVSEPLFCYYEPLYTFTEVGVELLIPRTSPIPSTINCP